MSTYLSYRIYSGNMEQSLSRIARDPVVTRDAKYYRDTIGTVKSVDDFLNNYRLFTYAMKAYGLQDMIYAKAFMRKVLLSNLSDSNSFANKLTDQRYRDFAKTFNFGTDGKVAKTAALQTTGQQSDTVSLYKDKYAQAARQSDADYYGAMIASATVDKIINDTRLRTFVLKAYSLDPDYISNDTLRSVLTSDASDPNSYASTLGDSRFVAMASAFNFAAGGTGQTDSQRDATIDLYLSTPETNYYKLKINNVTSVDELLDDSRLRSYIVTAYEFDPNISTATLRSALTSDLSGAFNFADGSLPVQSADHMEATVNLYFKNTNSGVDTEVDYYESQIGSITDVDQLLADTRLSAIVLKAYGFDPSITSMTAIRDALTVPGYASTIFDETGDDRFMNLAAAFDFADGGPIQSDAQIKATSTACIDRAEAGDGTTYTDVVLNTAKYQRKIASVSSVDGLFRDLDITDYIRKAYDLSESDFSTDTLKKVLTSDLSDPKSYVNGLHDSKLIALAKDFNLAADGSVATERVAQLDKNISTTTAAYSAALGTSAGAKAKAATETAYYKSAIAEITSLDQLLSDKRLTDYILTAYGLGDANVSKDTLRAVLTSDLSDRNSKANKLGDHYRDLAAAFNFTTSGTIGREGPQVAQSTKYVQATYDLYLEQTMESNAGEENPGVRLALYFQRKAASIDSAYDILADKALLEVVQATLSIPAESSQADIEIQARAIKSKVDFEDFQDPTKLAKFLARFAAMYDVKNNTSSSLNSTSLLLNSSTDMGINQDLLTSALGVRFNRT